MHIVVVYLEEIVEVWSSNVKLSLRALSCSFYFSFCTLCLLKGVYVIKQRLKENKKIKKPCCF